MVTGKVSDIGVIQYNGGCLDSQQGDCECEGDFE